MTDAAERAPKPAAEAPAGPESAGPESAGPESAGPADGGRRTRQAWLAAFAVFVVGVSVVLLVLVQRWRPIGVLRGRVSGAAVRVELADIARHVFRDGELASDGSYTVSVPPFAREPRVLITGRDGTAVASRLLEARAGVTEVEPYALWSTPIDITIDSGQVRFNWAPIPAGEGYPGRRRYSLLLRYLKQDGEPAEVSFLATSPGRTLPLAEVQDLLQGWDTSRPDVNLQVRAYDPGEKDGAQWTGGERTWTVPAPPTPTPAPPR